jgi:hypothetical protein
MAAISVHSPVLPRGPGQVMKWTGLPAGAIQGGYSRDLVALLANMLSTDPGARPSARQVYRECTRERQEIGIH